MAPYILVLFGLLMKSHAELNTGRTFRPYQILVPSFRTYLYIHGDCYVLAFRIPRCHVKGRFYPSKRGFYPHKGGILPPYLYV